MINEILHGDCLELMRDVPSGSVDMILCDLPYGTTACKWDSVIPFAPLWEQYERVIKPNGAIVLTAAQPFTSALVMSNTRLFRYSLVWDKVNRYTGALNANRMPMRRHEDILVFYKKMPTYNKQPTGVAAKGGKVHLSGHGSHTQYGDAVSREKKRRKTEASEHKNPCSIIEIGKEGAANAPSLHPTQKPVALFEYLIKTYTNPGDLILDNCSGSGTTAIAALGTGRRFICMEQDAHYVSVSRQRVADYLADQQ